MVVVVFLSACSVFFFSWSGSIFVLLSLFLIFSLKGFREMDWNGVSGETGLDTLSWLMVMLTLWVVFLIFLDGVSLESFEHQICLKAILVILLMAFSASSILKFYIWFELSLFPTFILILGWGYSPERMKASVYFVMYTVFASLPLLAVLTFCASKGYMFFSQSEIPGVFWCSIYFSIAWILAFLVKLPLYFFHLWLIKAHVEAPVAGSMVLASILLKLGGVGLVRAMMMKLTNFISEVLIIWALVGGVFASLSCAESKDIKVLIALSSVAHMSLVIGGILSGSSWGLNGSLLVMVGHGFCSSALFCLAGKSYKSAGSRSFKFLKGLQVMAPAMTFWWFMLVLSNMAAPPSLNLLGEIHLIISLVWWSKFLIFPLSLLVFLAAVYSLGLFLKSQSGEKMNFSFMISNNPSDYLVVFLHWLPLNFLILKWSILFLV